VLVHFSTAKTPFEKNEARQASMKKMFIDDRQRLSNEVHENIKFEKHHHFTFCTELFAGCSLGWPVKTPPSCIPLS